jgi:hypothetical protein
MINDIAGVSFTISKELIKQGHEVTLLAKKNKFFKYLDWVKTYKNKIDEFFLKGININSFDIIHLHYLTNWSSLGLFIKRVKHPIILHAHGSDTRPKNIFIKTVQRLVGSKSNTLLYSTPDLKENLKWFKRKLIYLPNPVAIPEKAFSVKKYKDRVLIFTTLHKIKKTEKIFKIIKNSQYKFDIIYLGPNKEYYLKNAPENVFFKKPVKHENLFRFLLRYQLIIGGSQDGAIRVCELEAMSLGIPTLFPFKYDTSYPSPLPMQRLNKENIKKHFGDSELGLKQKEWVNKFHRTSEVLNQLNKIYNQKLNK